MFEKMKLWWAKQQLAAARNHEAQMRASADHARDHILPALEAQVREMESRRNFRTFHKGRAHHRPAAAGSQGVSADGGLAVMGGAINTARRFLARIFGHETFTTADMVVFSVLAQASSSVFYERSVLVELVVFLAVIAATFVAGVVFRSISDLLRRPGDDWR